MNAQRLLIGITSVLATTAYAQGTVAEPAAATVNADGSEPGFFRPSPEVVLAPVVAPPSANSELRDKIAAAIANDPQMRGARIDVLVSDGIVTLSGTALDQAQADRARAITGRLAASAQVTAGITNP